MTLPILAEFAQKRATPHQVLRTLIAHDGWFAPVVWASEACKTDVFEKITLCGERSTVPADRLCLFTAEQDLVAAEQHYAANHNGHLGPYAGPLPGLELFRHLPGGLTSVEIDPQFAPGPNFSLPEAGVGMARSLAKAVALERALFGKGEDVVEQLLDFDRYILLAGPNGAPATAIGAAGMKNPAMVFTAEDAIDPVRASSGPGALSQHRRVIWTAEELFTRFDELGVDGILLLTDPHAIKGKPLTADACRGLAQSLRDRAEVRRLEALAREHDEI